MSGIGVVRCWKCKKEPTQVAHEWPWAPGIYCSCKEPLYKISLCSPSAHSAEGEQSNYTAFSVSATTNQANPVGTHESK